MHISRGLVRAAVAVSSLGLAAGLAGLAAAPGAAASPAVRYVALGDSYSSGLGAGSYISSSGSCDRSTRAYPEQWARANSPASFVSVACSGATTADVIAGQVPALSASTTLVSITIGGNDAGFASVMETCVLEPTSSCLKAISAAEAFVSSRLPGRLDATLAAIRAHAPAAKVVVLGYPEFYDLARSGSCIGLSTQDRAALNGGADALDSALATAAAAYRDTFADVRSRFAAGHEICDWRSWMNSVDLLDISASYHPNAAGQEQGYLPVFTAAAR